MSAKAKQLAAFDGVFQAQSLDAARAELGHALGLDGSAGAAVTLRVLNDGTFAVTLASVRKSAEWRDRMLNDPANAAFEVQEGDTSVPAARPPQSVTALLQKRAASMLRWGAAGFKTVGPEALERRREACGGCDQNVELPETLLYKLGSALGDGDDRMCQACGCIISTKTTMTTEQCPLPSPTDPRISRWGEPVTED